MNDSEYTTHDILIEVRDDIKLMGRQLAVLVSQNLDGRVNSLEAWKDRVDGRMSLLTAGVVFLGGLATILGGVIACITFLG